MYEINEELARAAFYANHMGKYDSNTATAAYQQMVSRAEEIADDQKKRIDPIHHDKVDALLESYKRRLADNINEGNRIDASVPSVMIAGPANFPTAKKEKQNAARERILAERREIEGLLYKIRSVGTAGISADDPDAIAKLQKKLEDRMALQEIMKGTNAYYRKHKTLDGCPHLSAEQAAAVERDMHSEWAVETSKPFATYQLSNNNAEIKRLKTRIEELKRLQGMHFEGWTFDGGEVVPDKEANRLRIYFDEKPDEDTRDALKHNGFHWSPKAGAWQRQLNENAVRAAKAITGIGPA